MSYSDDGMFDGICGYKCHMMIDGDLVILDICARDYALLALDFTVNGLQIDYHGQLKSKSTVYNVETMINHIQNKKLVTVDQELEFQNNDPEDQWKDGNPNFFAKCHHLCMKSKNKEERKDELKIREEK